MYPRYMLFEVIRPAEFVIAVGTFERHLARVQFSYADQDWTSD
jgi:hypothetical protein